MKQNSMTKKEYIKEHIIWSLILFLWCRKLFFRCIPQCTYFESLLVLLLIGITVMGVGIFVTWKKGRNYINLVENLILSWSVFVVLAYVEIFKQRMVIIGLLVSGISVFMTVLVLCRKIKRKDKKKFVIRNRVLNVINMWRRNLSFASVFLLVPIGASMMFNGTILNSKVEVAKVYGDEHCLEANIDVICDIDPERWGKLDVQQKLNVCQKIVNCEARYLGISHEIGVGTADLSEGTLAYYSEIQHKIVIDLEHLNNSHSYEVLETLIHECTHAYQYEQVTLYQKLDEESRNLLMFYDASVYLEEFADYEDGSEDFFLYYSQLAEINARKAGEEEAQEYIERVNEYLYGTDNVLHE